MAGVFAQAVREMAVWPDHGFEGIPDKLTVRHGRDASGRDLVVVSNAAHRAFSLPLLMIADGKLPDFFLERLKTL